MLAKNFSLKATALILSLSALLASSEMFATEQTCINRGCNRYDNRVEPAQANYQDETLLIPVVDQPIPFSIKNFKNNVEVNFARTVFEVEIPGLYSLDSFLLVNFPDVGDSIEDSVGGYITINGRKLLTFFNRETREDSSIVEFHFNDRLVYLQKGDQVSVVLSEFAPGTTVLARGFVMVALNNSR